MYRINNQISILEFITPFGQVDPENRWAKIADTIPWQPFEKRYAEPFCPDNGAPALPFRMTMGTLILKQTPGNSDDEVLANIIENPYHQYLIGLHEFTKIQPFSQRQITNFRKYMPQALIDEINELLFKPPPKDAPPHRHRQTTKKMKTYSKTKVHSYSMPLVHPPILRIQPT